MTRDERVLLVKGIAGMGNRMLAFASGLLYARLARRRVVVDWRDRVYGEGGRNVFFEYFAPVEIADVTSLPATDDVTPPFWRGRLDDHATDVIRIAPGKSADPELERRS